MPKVDHIMIERDGTIVEVHMGAMVEITDKDLDALKYAVKMAIFYHERRDTMPATYLDYAADHMRNAAAILAKYKGGS